jgi:indolepyruvate ferredoxin oxidoreductase
VSHLKITERPEELANKIAAGAADCYLGFDVLVATVPANLDHARPDKTIAVVSTSQVPTGAMVTHTDVQFPDGGGLRASIDRITRKDENVYLDAIGLAETLFDDHMASNMLVLGAAYQAGAIPVSAPAIEQAITLNGVAVAMNTHAFRAGRLLVADPTWLSTIKRHRMGEIETTTTPLTASARALIERAGGDGELRRLLDVRVPELIDYQDERYAREYVDFVARVRAAEQAALPGETRLSEAVARYLFKLMAYKDEYEVARLHLKADLARSLAEEFPGGVRVQYNLHPPLLRALGLTRKLKFGAWFDGAFRALRSMKGLRGTALDPFGRAAVRRVERALPGEYRAMIERTLGGLSRDTYERAVRAARLPDVIRGYEDIKLGNVDKYREEVRALGL